MSDLARLDGASQPLPYIPGTKLHPPQRIQPFLPTIKPLIRLLLDKRRPPITHPYRHFRSHRSPRPPKQVVAAEPIVRSRTPVTVHAPIEPQVAQTSRDASQTATRSRPKPPRLAKSATPSTPRPTPARFTSRKTRPTRTIMPVYVPNPGRADISLADQEAIREAMKETERPDHHDQKGQRKRDERRRERGCEVFANYRLSQLNGDHHLDSMDYAAMDRIEAHRRHEQEQATRDNIPVPQQAHTKPSATRGTPAAMHEYQGARQPHYKHETQERLPSHTFSEPEGSCMPYWAESIYHAMYNLAINVGSLIGTFTASILTFILGIIHCIITGVLIALAAVVDGLTTMLRIFFNVVTCHWGSGDWSWEWRHLTHVWNWGRKSRWVFDFVNHVSPPTEVEQDERIAKRNSIHAARKEEYKREQADRGNQEYGGYGGMPSRRQGTYALGPEDLEKGMGMGAGGRV